MSRRTQAWLRLLAAMTALTLAIGLVFSLIPVRIDMSVLMPERQNRDLELLFAALQEGPANKLILIGLESAEAEGPLARPGALSRAFKAELRRSGLFEQGANGEVSLDEAALDPFLQQRYRLNPPLDAEAFTAAGLRQALETLLARLQGLEAPVVKTIMAADPTLRTLAVAQHWRPSASARKHQGVWVSEDGRRVVLLARTRGAGFDFKRQEEIVRAVRAAVPPVAAEFGPLRLLLSGPSVIAVESRLRSEAESQRLMLLCVPLIVGLLLLFFRRAVVLPLAFLPLAAGFLAGTLAVVLAFGYVHITTLGFGVTLIGVTVDYPLHLMTRLRPGAEHESAARRMWPALILGALTTVLGFLPMVLSSFPGVAQLGVFTITGLAVAAAVTRWVLPGLVSVASGNLRPRILRVPEAAPRVMRALRLPAFGLGLLAVGVLIARGDGLWQQDLSALSPTPEATRLQDRQLRQDMKAADPRYLAVVSGATTEQVLQRSEALLPVLEELRTEGALSDFDLAARYLPSKAAQAARLAALPSQEALRASLIEAQDGLPFRAGAFEPFLQDLAAARSAPPLGPAELEAEALQLRLRGLFLERGGAVQGLVLLQGQPNPEALQATLARADVEGLRFLDLKQATQDLMNGYRSETLIWASLGGGLALLLLIVALRSARGVIEVALPVLLSVSVTAAIMSVISDGLSIVQLLALLMVAGLGIDYAVFLRQNEDSGAEDRKDSVYAVCLCAITSIAVFAALASASIPLLAQIGLTAAIGAALSLVFCFIFTAPRVAKSG